MEICTISRRVVPSVPRAANFVAALFGAMGEAAQVPTQWSGVVAVARPVVRTKRHRRGRKNLVRAVITILSSIVSTIHLTLTATWLGVIRWRFRGGMGSRIVAEVAGVEATMPRDGGSKDEYGGVSR
jgi:hypothetical protein